VEIWAGTACNDLSSSMRPRLERCVQLTNGTRPLSAYTQRVLLDFTADQFLVSFPNGMPIACPSQQVSIGLWVLVDENGDGTPEASKKFDLPYDGLPPSSPTDVQALEANEAVLVQWKIPAASRADVDSLQILCARGYGLQVFRTGSYGAAYKTTETVCP